MKDEGVCDGCKYCVEKCNYSIFNGSCDYLLLTGHSRMLVERRNGGVKRDSCICYERGKYLGRK